MGIILPIAVMNGFVLFILVLISLLKRFVAVYGDYTVTVNGQKSFVVPGGSPLSQALFAEKIYIPSACGGRGTCGFCKVRIVSGISEPLPIEEMILNFSDVSRGFRLSCQTKVRGDLGVEIPEELLSIKEYRGVVKDTQKLTRDIKRLAIGIKEPEGVFSFKSGQYVLFQVGPAEDPGLFDLLVRENQGRNPGRSQTDSEWPRLGLPALPGRG